MRVMLYGASDLKNLLLMFEKVANEMGFTPFNYMSGNIYYHNYGQNKWVDNSKENYRYINSTFTKIPDELPEND